jgi:hypothetical protein
MVGELPHGEVTILGAEDLYYQGNPSDCRSFHQQGLQCLHRTGFPQLDRVCFDGPLAM